jgi:dTDP-4-amino-4,6-dideoxygalactose transaminase
VRQRVLADLRAAGIGAIFHYVPLHDSPAGRKYGRAAGELPVTAAAGERLIRLPLWIGVEPHVDEIIGATKESVMRHMTVAARS